MSLRCDTYDRREEPDSSQRIPFACRTRRTRDLSYLYALGMSSLLERVTHDIADAMKQKDQASLGPLRMLKAALTNREVEKKRALDEAEAIQVVNSLVKQRRDSAEQFTAGGRPELAEKELAEIAFLQRYLPPAADEATIAEAIEAAVAETGAAGPKDMGKVMKAVQTRLTGLTVDGRALSEAVRNRLARP